MDTLVFGQTRCYCYLRFKVKDKVLNLMRLYFFRFAEYAVLTTDFKLHFTSLLVLLDYVSYNIILYFTLPITISFF
jgi:hypothetical protein